MRYFILITIIVVAASALLPSFNTGAEPVPPRREVVSLRYWTAPEHTRIVLDMSSECVYQVSQRSGPDRIVIDVPKGRLAAGLRKLNVGDGVVDSSMGPSLRRLALSTDTSARRSNSRASSSVPITSPP